MDDLYQNNLKIHDLKDIAENTRMKFTYIETSFQTTINGLRLLSGEWTGKEFNQVIEKMNTNFNNVKEPIRWLAKWSVYKLKEIAQQLESHEDITIEENAVNLGFLDNSRNRLEYTDANVNRFDTNSYTATHDSIMRMVTTIKNIINKYYRGLAREDLKGMSSNSLDAWKAVYEEQIDSVCDTIISAIEQVFEEMEAQRALINTAEEVSVKDVQGGNE